MWMCPTRGRSELMQRLLNACVDTGMSEEAVMWVDGDWEAYEHVNPPANWEKHGDIDHLETVEIFNTLFKMYPGERYYGFLEDDVIPKTQGWDKKLDIAAGDWNVVYCNDGHKTEDLRITAIGGEFFRALGYMFPPGFKHLFTDNVITELAKRLGLQVFRPDIVMEHRHPIYGVETDQTYEDTTANWEHDRKAYIDWLKDHADITTMRMKNIKEGDKLSAFISAPRKHSLSVCIIAKDEEANIAGCIESVSHIADEVLVTDTGSTDDTAMVAKDAGAEVSYFKWNDSFADARNENLQQANCDYVLWLDADERIYWEDLSLIHALLQEDKQACYMFVLQNINSLGGLNDECVQARMFPRRPGIYWKRMIHEQISWAIEGLGIEPVAVPIRIKHYGYLDPEQHILKIKRNLDILEEESLKDPDDYAIMMHSAHCYATMSQKDKSRELYLHVASGKTNAPNNWQAISHVHIAMMDLKQGNTVGGYDNLKKALKVDKNCMWAWFQLAEYLVFIGEYRRAMPIYKRLHKSGMPPQLQPLNLQNMRGIVQLRYIDTLTMVEHRAEIEKKVLGTKSCQQSLA